MSIYKRGRVYWYKFMWNGELMRESTKQGNDKVARQMESAHRTSLAKGEAYARESPFRLFGSSAKNGLRLGLNQLARSRPGATSTK